MTLRSYVKNIYDIVPNTFIVPDEKLETQTFVPSGVIAILLGDLPTTIVLPTTVLDVRLIICTVPSPAVKPVNDGDTPLIGGNVTPF